MEMRSTQQLHAPETIFFRLQLEGLPTTNLIHVKSMLKPSSHSKTAKETKMQRSMATFSEEKTRLLQSKKGTSHLNAMPALLASVCAHYKNFMSLSLAFPFCNERCC